MLAKIKERFEQDEVERDDVEWLIEQVEALEKRLNEMAQTNYCIICGDDATELRQGRFYCHECCN